MSSHGADIRPSRLTEHKIKETLLVQPGALVSRLLGCNGMKLTICSHCALIAVVALSSAAAFAEYPQQQPYGQPGYGQQQQPGYGPAPYEQTAPPYYGNPPSFPAQQLEDLVARIALYQDPLLAEVLTASTYPDQIQQASWWSHQHRYLYGDALARAIAADRLPWDPSVIGLMPFPMVLDMMAMDAGWTQQLGAAVLSQRYEVMDAVQRMRQRALDAGYLRDSPEQRVLVRGQGWIEIQPASAGYYYVPSYNPSVVYVRPRGSFVGAAITFGPRIYIGASFGPYGWGGISVDWRSRGWRINDTPWDRRWANREQYRPSPVAPGGRPPEVRREEPRQDMRRAGPPPVESHQRDIRKREDKGWKGNRGRDDRGR
jgi:hypothetical protein